MAHILPKAAYGETLPIVKAKEKLRGSGDSRRSIGAEYTAMLLFDGLAHVPVVVEGAELKISQDTLNEHNLKMEFVMARFSGLTIEFSGGDYGAVNYRGTAKSVEFVNLTPNSGVKEVK